MLHQPGEEGRKKRHVDTIASSWRFRFDVFHEATAVGGQIRLLYQGKFAYLFV